MMPEWLTEMSERVAVVETKLEDLHGNGRPGRVAEVEEKVEKLDAHRKFAQWLVYLVLGACSVIEALHTLRDLGVLPK